MKQVWKCDHCTQTDLESDRIAQHELKCSFNKINKKCYTCMYSYADIYDPYNTPCSIGLNTLKGEEIGNCTGWVYKHLEEERDNKINQLEL